MFQQQMLERRNFHYPPFYRLVLLTLMHTDPQKVNVAASFLAAQLRHQLPKDQVLGPEFPPVARIKAQYLKNIMVKLNRSTGFVKQKKILKEITHRFNLDPKYKSVRLKINVDPS
jgi:primosomal protein N' (replication factor Y)